MEIVEAVQALIANLSRIIRAYRAVRGKAAFVHLAVADKTDSGNVFHDGIFAEVAACAVLGMAIARFAVGTALDAAPVSVVLVFVFAFHAVHFPAYCVAIFAAFEAGSTIPGDHGESLLAHITGIEARTNLTTCFTAHGVGDLNHCKDDKYQPNVLLH